MKILQSPAFLGALVLLLLNDFILKYAYPGLLTGKLSDFAGLFIFPLFCFAFFPRHKKTICILSGMLFVFWKTPWAEGLLQAWNSLELLHWQRVVDYTDYWALCSIPLAYYYATTVAYRQVKINPAYLVVVVSFSFLATSAERPVPMELEYPPMVVFYIDKDSLPLVSPNRIESEHRGSRPHYEHFYTKYYDYPYFHLETSDTMAYLIMRSTHWSYYNSQADAYNYVDQKTVLEKEQERVYEALRESVENAVTIAEHFPLLSLHYDSLAPPKTVELFPNNYQRVNRLALDTEMFEARYQVQFENSVLHGPIRCYYPSGKLKYRGNYLQGLRQGLWESFNEAGARSKAEYFEQGRLQAFAHGETSSLTSVNTQGQRIYAYNVLCLVGLFLLAGYGLLLSYRGIVTTQAFKAREQFWSFVLHLLLSIGACMLILLLGASLTIFLGLAGKGMTILQMRYIPKFTLLIYLLCTFAFFLYTEKYRYLYLFSFGFPVVYLIANTFYYLAELNSIG